MSTTADKAVALHYANGKGTVVEINVGRIQIGGDVSFLSMVLVVPLQGCDLQRGARRLQKGCDLHAATPALLP
jgi:hypothetical protein